MSTIRFLISMILSRLSFANLAAFAQRIHDGFIAEIADYATPNPLMAAFQSDIDALNAAITAWGPRGNRGSHSDYLALRAAASIVRNDLRMLADYASNTQPDNPDSWTLVGFNVKRPKSAPTALEMVQNLRHFIARDIPSPFIKLKWKRPLSTDPGDVKGYIIQYGNTNVQPEIDGSRGVVNVIGIVTSTNIILEPPFTGANYFWVTPFNSIGYGVSSDPLFYNAAGKI
jgi:hypothetical protein